MDISMIRGDTTVFTFAVVDSEGVAFSLASCDLTFTASNGIVSLVKTTDASPATITITDEAGGEGEFEVGAVETADWADYVHPLAWTLVLTASDDSTYTVGHGVLIVNIYSEEVVNA